MVPKSYRKLRMHLEVEQKQPRTAWFETKDVARTKFDFLGFVKIERFPFTKRESIWARGSTPQSFDTFRTLSTVNSGDFLAGETAKRVARTNRDFVGSCFFHIHFLVTLLLIHLPFFVDHRWTEGIVRRWSNINELMWIQKVSCPLAGTSCKRKKITHCQSISVTFRRRHWQIRFLYPRFGDYLIEVLNNIKRTLFRDIYRDHSQNYDLPIEWVRIGLRVNVLNPVYKFPQWNLFRLPRKMNFKRIIHLWWEAFCLFKLWPVGRLTAGLEVFDARRLCLDIEINQTVRCSYGFEFSDRSTECNTNNDSPSSFMRTFW